MGYLSEIAAEWAMSVSRVFERKHKRKCNMPSLRSPKNAELCCRRPIKKNQASVARAQAVNEGQRTSQNGVDSGYVFIDDTASTGGDTTSNVGRGAGEAYTKPVSGDQGALRGYWVEVGYVPKATGSTGKPCDLRRVGSVSHRSG